MMNVSLTENETNDLPDQFSDYIQSKIRVTFVYKKDNAAMPVLRYRYYYVPV